MNQIIDKNAIAPSKKNNFNYEQKSAIAKHYYVIPNYHSMIPLLYSCGEDNTDELFWENISEPYRSILEDCYCIAEDGKFTTLKQITNNIKYDRLNYIKLGTQLYQVKYYQLYKGVYNSFKDYCQQEIHYPVWRVNKIIKASKVAIQLIKYGFRIIPQNEAQARPLVKLNETELYEKWQEVLDTYPFHSITAKKIKKIVYGEDFKEKGTIKLPIEVVQEIEIKAMENGVSVGELISKIFQGKLSINQDGTMENTVIQGEEIIEKVDSQLIENWQKDLHKMTESEPNKIDDFAENLAEEIKNTVIDIKFVIKKCFVKSFLKPFLNNL